MKTCMKISTLFLSYVFFLIAPINVLFAQDKPSIAIVSIDTKDLNLDNVSMGSLVRLELEKTDTYEVLDKYDVADIMKQNGIDPAKCFGKTQLVKVGKLLKADKMLSGSAEKFGEKIIIILRMIDVKTEKIEKTNVMEYLDQQSEIQVMVEISIKNLLEIPNDEILVDLLVNYDRPITSPKTTVRLNGPRMGATYTTGKTAKRMEADKNEGGFGMYPISSMFGYQFELQYLSSGDFQALVELIPALNGLESGYVVPSITFMNGFRFNKYGLEFGLGPVIRVVQTAEGYYDETDKWHLAEDLPEGSNYTLEHAMDNRGEYGVSTGLIIAVGKTFRSGYLNMPVNLYFSPRKEGNIVGVTVGFNIAQKPKLRKE
ncbi:MAG: hypothetical protein K9H64_23800 [Bacteroidales bacterium]|nr:hypothetical protein [Bacteroidales bacterium]MCF8457785.1 hypothetical protein [Bacteroidales bacterium]